MEHSGNSKVCNMFFCFDKATVYKNNNYHRRTHLIKWKVKIKNRLTIWGFGTSHKETFSTGLGNLDFRIALLCSVVNVSIICWSTRQWMSIDRQLTSLAWYEDWRGIFRNFANIWIISVSRFCKVTGSICCSSWACRTYSNKSSNEDNCRQSNINLNM